MKFLIFAVLISCGKPEDLPPDLPLPEIEAPEVEPPLIELIELPNIEQACDRAILCEAFTHDQRHSCVACLEHIDPKALAQIGNIYPELPSLEIVDCGTIRDIAHQYTNLAQCVVAQWYGR